MRAAECSRGACRESQQTDGRNCARRHAILEESKSPIPVQGHVIWHPKSDSLCRGIADSIYVALNRDPERPLLPGNCMPVLFRSVGADPADESSAPRPILLGDTELGLRLVLRTSAIILLDAWSKYVDGYRKEIRRRPQKALMVVFRPVQG